ncbi:MAG: ribose ABC transporter, partial [Alphaproteobacteria bacterium]|nr:ribose ABC transporter [Alphaproteobacteria bacterium]
VTGKLLRMDNLTAAAAIEAILTVFPLDSFVEHPAERMGITGDESKVLPVHREVQAAIDKAEGKSLPLGIVSRFDFYERARRAYAVIVTGETRFYGCFLLKKGVIPPKDA